MRLATWNVNSVTARVPRLLEWLRDTAPDVLAVQETKVAADGFPTADVEALGYAVAHHGEGRWNGVAIVSRVGLDDVVRGLDGGPVFPDPGSMPEARAIAATCGPIRVWSVYVPNGREPGHAHYAYKLQWLAALRTVVEPDARGDRPFAVMGDFNIAPTDSDVWDIGAFEGATHVTAPERAALEALRTTGLHDVIGRAMKHDTPYTYWDYRAGNFHKNLGMRIDLVYANAPFTDVVRDAYVDRDARKGKGPSDHAPLVVDLEL